MPTMTASEALALGAIDAGVHLVTGYPGSPSTETFESVARLAASRVRTVWAINEKSAFDMAFGATLTGLRSLLCIKSVGLNVALDSLLVGNLAPGPGGFVILSGDDPGGWGSQNEEDSRLLAVAAEVPLLEPTLPTHCRDVMRQAFRLSERFALPVVLRITRALASEAVSEEACGASGELHRPLPIAARFARENDRFVVLPIHVVTYHRRLQARLQQVRNEFETSGLNSVEGHGRSGVLAAGHLYHKLKNLLERSGGPPLLIFRLTTIHPLPEKALVSFLEQVEQVLVLEELAPYIERELQALAQRMGQPLPVLGRSTGHLPGTGELTAPDIIAALRSLTPDWQSPLQASGEREMPSRQPLCDGCPYRPAFRCLLDVMQRNGGRDRYIVTGETGCMVRGQLPPWQLLDVKYGMGSSIGLALGLAVAGVPQRLVALSGDSALLHSGLGELIDAVQAGVDLLVVVLENQTTALSGGQPHPASAHDARGAPRQPVDLAALVRAAGVKQVWLVDPLDSVNTQAALEAGLSAAGVSLVIMRRACPKWLTAS